MKTSITNHVRQIFVDKRLALEKELEVKYFSRDLSDWKAESRGEHARIDGRVNTLESEFDGKIDGVKMEIKAERDRADTIERTTRAQNAQKWLSIGLAALATVVSVGGIIVNIVGG